MLFFRNPNTPLGETPRTEPDVISRVKLQDSFSEAMQVKSPFPAVHFSSSTEKDLGFALLSTLKGPISVQSRV